MKWTMTTVSLSPVSMAPVWYDTCIVLCERGREGGRERERERERERDKNMLYECLSCFQDVVNGYVCQCEEGWNGTECDQEIDECDPDPCHHGNCTVCIY